MTINWVVTSHYLDTWDSSFPPRWWAQHKAEVGSWQWSRGSGPAGSSSVCSCRCPSAPRLRTFLHWSGTPLSLQLYLLWKENSAVSLHYQPITHKSDFIPRHKSENNCHKETPAVMKRSCPHLPENLCEKRCHFCFFIKYIISLGCFSSFFLMQEARGRMTGTWKDDIKSVEKIKKKLFSLTVWGYQLLIFLLVSKSSY